MASLKWTISNAVFVTEIDDQHKEIFEALSNLQKALAGAGAWTEISTALQRLITSASGHFAHEERLMRAARYSSMRWHKTAHDAAHRRVAQFAARMEHGETQAGTELVGYLTSWLHEHTGLADRMLGAFLRNQQRSLGKLTLQAGTRPLDACAWVDVNGEAFRPPSVRESPKTSGKSQ